MNFAQCHRRAPPQTTSKPHMAQDRSATNKRVYTRALQSDSVEAGVMRWRWLSIISSELMGFSQQSVHCWKEDGRGVNRKTEDLMHLVFVCGDSYFIFRMDMHAPLSSCLAFCYRVRTGGSLSPSSEHTIFFFSNFIRL